MDNFIVVDSRKPFEEACQALERSVTAHKFGVLHIHDLKKKLHEKGLAFDREVRVFDICNPQRAKETLEHDIRVAAMLPCAVAVHEEGGGSRFICARPSVMLDLAETAGLEEVAAEVEGTLKEIMASAAR